MSAGVARWRRLVPALAPPVLRRAVLRLRVARAARLAGLTIRRHGEVIDVYSGVHVIRIASRHEVYLNDIVTSFDYYFRAVRFVPWYGHELVDYSSPRLHDVVGFSDFPVLFPSFCEPVATARQYLDFAELSPGMTVLDLGAYSGLTAILFAQQVMPGGRVVAVEADPQNLNCVRRNLEAYERSGVGRIELRAAAMWNHERGLVFSGEGNMGSSAVEFVGAGRGLTVHVDSVTLSGLVRHHGLQRVDFVKCDIEGAERVIFEDAEFFQRFRPRIVVETHVVDGVETTDACMAALTPYGYHCRRIEQHGVSLPLLECSPGGRG